MVSALAGADPGLEHDSSGASAPKGSPSEEEIVVALEPCELKRDHSIYVKIIAKTSRDLCRVGTVTLGEEAFSIYLPEDDSAYSAAPRPDRPGMFNKYTSSYLAVDQNHDGKIESWESYFAEFPLRIGDRMFDVLEIAPDGSSLSLRSRSGPLMGAVVGRRAPKFSFETVDGRVVDNASVAGRATLIDVWSPG